MSKTSIITAVSALVLVGATVGVYMYTSGLRIDKQGELKSTGMVAVKSVPNGANVYLNSELKTATDGTIQGLNPGKYNLKVMKNGFTIWQKDIDVFEQLVTDITAVLVSKTPRLEPLTSTGARNPVISPSLTKIAYFTKDGENPGVWVYPLGGNLQVNLFKTSPGVVLEDTAKTIYSNGEQLEWSPDERELLVTLSDAKSSIGGRLNLPTNNPTVTPAVSASPSPTPTVAPVIPDTKKFFIVKLDKQTAESTSSAELTRAGWQVEVAEKRELFLSKLQLDENVTKLANDPGSLWSPDEKKFLYKEVNGDEVVYKVYNLEKPLPVGEKTNYTVFTEKKDAPQPKVYWYSDSFHLISVYGDVEKEKKGTIYLTRIDGTNKVELYNNTLYSDVAYSTPNGDKIVILAGFKSDGQPDLYAIGIR
jgi:hypothetical protein